MIKGLHICKWEYLVTFNVWQSGDEIPVYYCPVCKRLKTKVKRYKNMFK